ncbi:MAG: aminoacetone oxidase family FAD-binding enzyme [bacterium]|nr:aminoacetone oxidase family FAD-binding enzyme [bacterium]
MKSNKMFDVIIIGGGASGLFAGAVLSLSGLKCIIVEKNGRVGKKLLQTGNGKCNLSNRDMCLKNYYGDSAFIKRIFDKAPQKRILSIFESIGIEIVEGENGKLFPKSMQASSVLDSLRFAFEEHGGLFALEREALSIARKDNKLIVKTESETDEFCSDAVIIATGGMAGLERECKNFFTMIKRLGHTVKEVMPSLVQLKLDKELYKSMAGNRVEGGIVLYSNSESVSSDRNEILFTEYGISGNAVLNISREASLFLMQGKKVELSVDLLPDETLNETKSILKRRMESIGKRKAENLLNGWINKRVGMAVLKSSGIDLSRQISSLTDDEGERISEKLHDFRFKVKDTNGFRNAQVMAGGVATDEVSPDTMESEKEMGIFFTGEILDVDGKSGGYNLHFAWASALVAADAISKRLKN